MTLSDKQLLKQIRLGEDSELELKACFFKGEKMGADPIIMSSSM